MSVAPLTTLALLRNIAKGLGLANNLQVIKLSTVDQAAAFLKEKPESAGHDWDALKDKAEALTALLEHVTTHKALPAPKAAAAASDTTAAPRGRGRPAGSTNKPKPDEAAANTGAGATGGAGGADLGPVLAALGAIGAEGERSANVLEQIRVTSIAILAVLVRCPYDDAEEFVSSLDMGAVREVVDGAIQG